jgi:hypothetical protein
MRTIPEFRRPASGEQRRNQDFLILAGEVAVSIGAIQIRLKPGQLLAGHHTVTHEHNAAAPEAVLLEVDSPSGIEDYFNSVGESLLIGTTANLPLPAHTLAKISAISLSKQI